MSGNVKTNVDRVISLRLKGWSDRAIARHMAPLPIGTVRTILIENAHLLPKKLRWIEAVA